ncbi:twin-arginine translocase subunit TatB [Chitinibacter fontanus]|uniref:Sec-independent protein translocase protein TatB n=1 Tax=Chitinibacter fontanus TaxID=1737446 RepID=A0A7D5VA08_9NEIS|nr:Sec-independent protein translocase protein TatB [Chitinibacter fontanus]QLI81795.1 twin-arginine translocase subunit TatB [Chitinibacter fontanus]
MFDVSLGELLVIGAVTLVVVGPEKMPKVARTAGMLFGRLQRFANNVKADLHREMQASELAQIQQEIEAEAAQIKQTIHQPLAQAQAALAELDSSSTRVEPSLVEEPMVSTRAQNVVTAPETGLQATPEIRPEPPRKSREKKVVAEPEAISATEINENQLDLFADLDEVSHTPHASDRR